MTMNPHANLNDLRNENRSMANASANAEANANGATHEGTRSAKRSFSPAALLSAGFILLVTLITNVFYD